MVLSNQYSVLSTEWWVQSVLNGGDQSVLNNGYQTPLNGGDQSVLNSGYQTPLNGGDQSVLNGGHSQYCVFLRM